MSMKDKKNISLKSNKDKRRKDRFNKSSFKNTLNIPLFLRSMKQTAKYSKTYKSSHSFPSCFFQIAKKKFNGVKIIKNLLSFKVNYNRKNRNKNSLNKKINFKYFSTYLSS
ncbi:hypothetical protein BNATCHR2117 (nucleomorph) [Bigelowiella natans]|uniref:Uncharacterized protein n=1 Tax=Bigelowiella natans TaxID=227086 RepID=Q3LW23_BIGNA|nr:hypothetical protein BNATCHR2117 [Bigelowiella natans]ABA27342.1 hypothetical protein [Bigelowiella natans]|mmetsp:Transcript_13561/g.16203  ORF Transcript_13561/g.16203 Transcript_13561/m.16203 type:complete len:111 (+) Transcript_13561:635-967(+)